MKTYFFPRDRTFWVYQFGGQAILLGVQLILGIFIEAEGKAKEHQVVALVSWNILFLLCVLYYRSRYKAKFWSDLSTPVLFGKTLLFVALLASGMVLILLSLLMPLYWPEMLAHEKLIRPNLNEREFIKMMVLGNTTSTSFFILAWTTIYIGITNSRKAKQSQLDNLKLQNSLKEAQLSSLSNQLNPHFLFNSLNNIRFMIHENAEQADNMITALSEVLRYSLESSQHQKLLLSKEIEIIEKYMAIVDIQFEDRLNFEMDIPASARNILIPPMLLQMLIENAVKHGLEQIQEGGSILLKAQELNGVVSITVSNDIPTIPRTPQLGSNNTGIGLKNIAQRLSLIYGNRASISTSEADGKYVVSINLPIEKNLAEAA